VGQAFLRGGGRHGCSFLRGFDRIDGLSLVFPGVNLAILCRSTEEEAIL
jgi:hypothetical protein